MRKFHNGNVFVPAYKPLHRQQYVLQMASQRSWTQQAQAKHLTLWREALLKALDNTNRALSGMNHDFVQGAEGRCDICTRKPGHWRHPA